MIIIIFLHKSIFCDLSLEPSHQDGSNEGSYHVFVEKYEKLSLNYLQYPFLSGALFHNKTGFTLSRINDPK